MRLLVEDQEIEDIVYVRVQHSTVPVMRTTAWDFRRHARTQKHN